MASSSDIAWSYFELLSEGRLEEAVELLDDDGSLWNSGTRTAMPFRELKDNVRKLWDQVPMRFVRHDAWGAGDRAVLELESHATRPDGTPYNNVYCFVVTIADGKITQLREYTDYALAMDMTDSAGGWPPT
jgi:ketosteroid isomerase-like protein